MSLDDISHEPDGDCTQVTNMEVTASFHSFPKVSQWADYQMSDEEETSISHQLTPDIKLEEESHSSPGIHNNLNPDKLENHLFPTNPNKVDSRLLPRNPLSRELHVQSSSQSVMQTNLSQESSSHPSGRISMLNCQPILIAPPPRESTENHISNQTCGLNNIEEKRNKNWPSSNSRTHKVDDTMSKLLQCVQELETEGYDALAVVHNYDININKDWYGYCGHGELSRRFLETRYLCPKYRMKAGRVFDLGKDIPTMYTTHATVNTTSQSSIYSSRQTSLRSAGHTFQCESSTDPFVKNACKTTQKEISVVNIRPISETGDQQERHSQTSEFINFNLPVKFYI